MTFDIDFIRRHYATFSQRVAEIRNRKGGALTLSEKILFAHLYTPTSSIDTTYGNFRPDRVAMQDATAQMALLQFMNAGKVTLTNLTYENTCNFTAFSTGSTIKNLYSVSNDASVNKRHQRICCSTQIFSYHIQSKKQEEKKYA